VADSIKTQFAQHQQAVTAALDHAELLEQVAERIIECIEAGGKLLVLGNGGSAADAQHIAAELIGRFKHDRRALPAVALTTDTSVLTAVANDVGVEHMYARQVEALATKQDVVWALSVSGRSPNVLRALERAREAGAHVVGFTGRNGDALKELCDQCFMVKHDASDRVQEVHQLAYHVICDRIEQHFRESA
jgi:D-sedoheptulose 7-phosphate isomerase